MAPEEPAPFGARSASSTSRLTPSPGEEDTQAEVHHIEVVDPENDPSSQKSRIPAIREEARTMDSVLSRPLPTARLPPGVFPPAPTANGGYTEDWLNGMFKALEVMIPLDESFIINTHKLDNRHAGLLLLTRHLDKGQVPRLGKFPNSIHISLRRRTMNLTCFVKFQVLKLQTLSIQRPSYSMNSTFSRGCLN